MFDVEGTFRSILWNVAYLVLKCTDHIYGIVSSLFGLQLSDFPWIWDFFKAFTALTAVFVLFRLGVIWFKSLWDESTIEKVGGVELVRRIVSVCLIMSLIPVLLPALSSFAADAAVKFPTFIQVDMQPSDVIIDSGMADFSSSLSTSVPIVLEEGQHAIDVITADTINNEVNGEYVYIPETTNILLILLLGTFCAYCFGFVAIQIVQRLVGLMIKILMAPFAVSGLIDPNDNGTSTWFHMCISDFLTAFFQMVLIWVAMEFCSTLPSSFGGLTKGIVFVGAIFSIMIAPQGVAQILGNDVGSQSAMQAVQQAMMFAGAANTAVNVTRTAVSYARSAVKAGGSAASVATSGLKYAIGQKMGGRSLNPGTGTASTVNSQQFAGFAGTPKYYGTGSVGDSSGTYTTSSSSDGSAATPTGIQAKDGTSGYAGPDGIAHFADGSVTENGSFADRFAQKAATSTAGAMASTFARHRYEAAARRLYSTPQSRASQKTAGTIAHNVKTGFNDYRTAVTAAKQNRAASKGTSA